LSLGGLPEGVWPPQDGLQSLCPLERAGHLAENIRGGCFSFRVAETSRAGQQSCQGSSLRQRRKRGAEFQAIGLTKGGRNSKIHAIVDKFLRPWVLILTPGNTADCTMAQECVSLIPGIKELLADKGYDTDAFRAFLKDQKIKPVIPGKSNRKKRIRHNKKAYKKRNVIERCFGRLKDFRRIATRYDKLAGNFFSALCLVAIVAYWL
jgi:transposase